jgi:hypothetical protein
MLVAALDVFPDCRSSEQAVAWCSRTAAPSNYLIIGAEWLPIKDFFNQ